MDTSEILEIFNKVVEEHNIEKTEKFQKDLIPYSPEELMDFKPNLDFIDN